MLVCLEGYLNIEILFKPLKNLLTFLHEGRLLNREHYFFAQAGFAFITFLNMGQLSSCAAGK